MRRRARALTTVMAVLLLAAVAPPLFSQAAPQPGTTYCVARFQHEIRHDTVWQGGTAFIDYGTGNLQTLQVESMATFLNDMSEKGWELVSATSITDHVMTLLVFRKR